MICDICVCVFKSYLGDWVDRDPLPTPPKLDSYKHSYQAWGHAMGQPARKGYSCSHAD